ncbi:CapA family protein [Novosphingobium sp. RD2P27]|uniref:CapA family protein n=1 Tax=Novosphingobium kalidii TaxID=3230299 RepID=A0ABV2D1K4_9SPHN
MPFHSNERGIARMFAPRKCSGCSRSGTRKLHLSAFALAGAMCAASAGAEAPPADGKLSIALTGQALIHTDFRTASPETVAAVKPLLKGDVVFTNFEGAVAIEGAKAKGFLTGEGFHSPAVAAPAASLDALKDLGFNLLALSNNHAWDLQGPGILSTMRAMKARGLTGAGIGKDLQQAAAPAYLKTPDGTVALVSLASGSIAKGAGATAAQPGINELRVADRSLPDADDKARILGQIRKAARKADVVIAYHHNHVFQSSAPFFTMMNEQLPERLYPSDWVKRFAHEEVDAGANVVVMHGAPLLHGVEVYKGAVILYGLGNFIFQLEPTPPRFEETMVWRSVIATVDFKDRKLQGVRFKPVAIDKGRDEDDRFIARRGMPAPANSDQARYTLERLAQLSQPFGTTLRIDGDQATIDLNATK